VVFYATFNNISVISWRSVLFVEETVSIFISLGDNLRGNYGRSFSTKDSDNDQSSSKCADIRHGAWWFGDCGDSSLNGKYFNKAAVTARHVDSIAWYYWRGKWNLLKKTYMMIRRF